MKKTFAEKLLEKTTDVYLVSDYVNAKTKVTLGCREGHMWQVIPSNLISRGDGLTCRECYGKHKSGKKTNEDFLKEVYSKHPNIKVLGEYRGSHIPILISCENGHEREVTPTNLITREYYSKCYKCGDTKDFHRLTIGQVQERIAKHYPQLEVLSYTSSSETLICHNKDCGHDGDYWLSNLVQGRGYACKVCNPSGVSDIERQIQELIRNNYDKEILLNDRSLIKPKEIDIVLPDIKLAFEINGAYWHTEERVGDSHLAKTNALCDLGYQLIHIYDYDWIYNKEIVKSRILQLLGKSYKLYARNTEVKEISFPREFLNENHIQGAGAPSSINLGLFFKEELVAVMTFGKPRFSKEADYELLRFATLTGISVVGGASKLLKYFTNKYTGTIISYAARDWSAGKLYTTLGFTHSHNTAPGYSYYKNSHKLSRYKCQKQKLKELFPEYYEPTKTEGQIMKEAGYNKVLDSGNMVFIKS